MSYVQNPAYQGLHGAFLKIREGAGVSDDDILLATVYEALARRHPNSRTRGRHAAVLRQNQIGAFRVTFGCEP